MSNILKEPADPKALAEKELKKAQKIQDILSGKTVTPRQIRLRREREKKRMERKQQREEKRAQRKRKRETSDEEEEDRKKSICEGLGCTVQLQMGLSKHLGQPIIW